ncbi:MAG: hypothetical protein AB9834_08730 [Lentimicrobium sp.]
MKKLTFTIVALFLVCSINAQTDSCRVLAGKISGTYTGKCLNGLANGKGKSSGEDTYTGNFKDGLPDGKGKYLFKNGDIYEGYWKSGQKDGKGKFEYTLNGKKYTLTGYWEKDEFAGTTNPDISYRVTSASGINNYKVEKNEAAGENNNEITISVRSAFTDYIPQDLKIENSSGKVLRSGKKIGISQYYCPLHCEISYTILISDTRKQCRFIIEVLEEGNYTIILSND